MRDRFLPRPMSFARRTVIGRLSGGLAAITSSLAARMQPDAAAALSRNSTGLASQSCSTALSVYCVGRHCCCGVETCGVPMPVDAVASMATVAASYML